MNNKNRTKEIVSTIKSSEEAKYNIEFDVEVPTYRVI